MTYQRKDEWVNWGGGACPVDEDALVEVTCRDGGHETGKAYFIGWEHAGTDEFEKPEFDVVAYRVIRS